MGPDDALRRLRRLLEAAEYQVSERPEGWAAVRSSERRVIVLLRDVRSPRDVEPAFPPDAIHRAIVYPAEPGDVARSLAGDRGIEVFTPATIALALGEILLGAAEERAEAAAPDDALELPPSVVPPGDQAVLPRLAREEAERIVTEPGLRPVLRWVPYLVAPYRVRAPSPHGGPGRTSEHLVAVNAVRGRAESWEPSDYELGALPEERMSLPDAEIAADDARAIATEWIRRRHAVRVDHTEQHGGTVVVETRRVPPRPEDVRVGQFGRIYVPFWYFEGTAGRVVLNAVTGRRYPGDEEREATL